jgi:excisionase family DNA binding protein
MAQERVLLRVSEAAERLGISRTKAYELAARNELPGVMRVGGSIRVNVRRLDEWIEAESTTRPGSAA